MKLTKRVVDSATYRGGTDYRWDSSLAGFGLRIYPSGRKSFVVSYRVAGRRRTMVLGRYGALTVQQARDQARGILFAATEGVDSAEERQAARTAPTVADLCEMYLERHARPHKKTWRSDERRVEKYILPALGRLRVEEVTREHVGDLYRRVGARAPMSANRLLACLSMMFGLASEWGLAPENFSNPARMRKRYKFREKRRDRPVTSEELPRLLAAIDAEPDPWVRGILQLFLLTGLRKGELLNARWADIDFGRATLRLPDTKNGEPRHVPLSTHALRILRNLPRMVGNPHVFPSKRATGKHLNDLYKPWNRIREEAGCPDLRIHDLRHSVATWMADAGHAAQFIQKALGHQSLQTTMRYIHAANDAPRAALDQLGESVLQQHGVL